MKSKMVLSFLLSFSMCIGAVQYIYADEQPVETSATVEVQQIQSEDVKEEVNVDTKKVEVNSEIKDEQKTELIMMFMSR